MTERTEKYRKDPRQENLLEKVNRILEPLERNLVMDFTKPKKPVLFIVGAPRSATTLLHQLLARTGYLGYISNFVAKFWKAPYFGSLQEKALGLTSEISFSSDYGRTIGLSSPHQFNYFWQDWFKFDENQRTDESIINNIDVKYFNQEIAALEASFSKPIVFKSLHCGMQISFLKKALKTGKFVICLRNPLYQAQSILLGRKAFFGDYNGWFSLKPKEYPDLITKDPFEQVAAQVFYILKSIEKDIKNLSKDDYTFIHHDEFSNDPKSHLIKILKLAYKNTDSFQIESNIPDNFENRNQKRLNDNEWHKLKKAVEKYFDKETLQVPFSELLE